ncbi:MAG: hypothetical protein V1922_03185 [bacterium]
MLDNAIFPQIVEKIISEQEGIIGPIAIEQAGRVKGLKVNWPKHEITFMGKESDIIEELIEQYRDFFGQVSVEVCRHAVRKLVSQLPPDQQPMLLK